MATMHIIKFKKYRCFDPCLSPIEVGISADALRMRCRRLCEKKQRGATTSAPKFASSTKRAAQLERSWKWRCSNVSRNTEPKGQHTRRLRPRGYIFEHCIYIYNTHGTYIQKCESSITPSCQPQR